MATATTPRQAKARTARAGSPWLVTEERHRLGVLIDARTVQFERTFPVDAGRLWEEVSTPRAGSWWIPSAKVSLRPVVGSRFAFDDMVGTVVDADERSLLVLHFDNGSGAIFRVQDADAGTTLTFTHWMPFGVKLPADRSDWSYQVGGPGTYQPALAACWHGSLFALDRRLGAEMAPGLPEPWEGVFAPYKASFAKTYRQLTRPPRPKSAPVDEAEASRRQVRSEADVFAREVAGKTDEELAALAAGLGGYPYLLEQIFAGMRVSIRATADCSVGFDVGGNLWTLSTRRGVASVRQGVARSKARVAISPEDFLRVIFRHLSPADAAAAGRMRITGDEAHVETMFRMLARETDAAAASTPARKRR